MTTTILFGPPGTGKTTRLIQEVENAIESGVPPNRIAVLTFTRQAANEVVERACEKFKLQKRDFPYFRTLHSLAFRTKNINRQEVMTAEHFQDLAKHLGGFTFEHDYDPETERLPYGGGLGDRCLALYGYAKATRSSQKDAWRLHADPTVSWENYDLFVRTLEEYKRAKVLYDFTDFLESPDRPLDVDTFIVDEAQDLTRQQWDYVFGIWGTATQRIVAGDDDQAIFQWAGADISTFQNLQGERVVLPTSHRLPIKVWELSNRVSVRIKSRVPKLWEARADEGTVQGVSELGQCPLHIGSWLIVARHQYQLKGIEENIRQLGYPYRINGRNALEESYVLAIRSYEHLRAGHALSYSQAATLEKFIPGFKLARYEGLKAYEQISWPFQGRPDWMTAFGALGFDRKEYIRTLLRNGYSLKAEPQIRISTIHSTKGSEADNVLVYTDMSRTAFTALQDNPDPELRVWYVAATRARHNLYIHDPATNRYFPY